MAPISSVGCSSRTWKLILGLILVVAAIFHAFAADAFPWMFPFAVAMGLACWILVLAMTQAHYLLMCYFAKRSELRDATQPPPGR